MRESGGMLLVSGKESPLHMKLRDDLRTRLGWGLVYQVHGLSDEEKALALCSMRRQKGSPCRRKSAQYLLRHGRRDLPSLMAVLDALDEHSLRLHRAPQCRCSRKSCTGAEVNLALFDLDNTFSKGDSDFEWSQFLIRIGVLDRELFEARNLAFYEHYKAGTLDIQEFLDFQLKPLSRHARKTLDEWHRRFMREQALGMITNRRATWSIAIAPRSDVCAIITATNSFVTAPIAREFGIEHLIATEPEQRNGEFTGRVAGVPSFREGKIIRLENWHGATRLETGQFCRYDVLQRFIERSAAVEQGEESGRSEPGCDFARACREIRMAGDDLALTPDPETYQE